MSCPEEWYQMEAEIAARLPGLRPAQQRGLSWWVFGTLRAGSGCLNAVVRSLVLLGWRWDTVRDALREWLLAGADKKAPCRTEVEVCGCFAPLLRWVLAGWTERDLPLAIDATAHGDRVVALVVSVLYQGSAIPVAWQILPANTPGAWLAPIVGLLETLAPAVPAKHRVVVMADRGLWSPTLWQTIRQLGWHPLLRLQSHSFITPVGQERRPARRLVPGPEHAWVGAATVFSGTHRQHGTVLVVWGAGEADPWVLLTDLPVERVGVSWYGLRGWIELGFRALKGVGFQWHLTRRTDPDRVARHWLVLAIAMHWALAAGTRVELAQALRVPPASLTVPPATWPHPPPPRRSSLFAWGLAALQDQVRRGPLWCSLWLTPHLWPEPPPSLHLTIHPLCPLPT